MTVASHVHRALTSSSSNTLLSVNARTGTKKREQIAQSLTRNTATLSYPQAESSSSASFEIQIFDIFDAPSRLGESSKLLRLECATKAAGTAATKSSSHARSLHTASQSERASRVIKPLPSPIIYDGPARPKHMSMAAYRAAPRARSLSTSPVTEGAIEPHSMPAPLPPPVIFDGPSRLRPYARCGPSATSSEGISGAFPSSSTMLLLGVAGLATYAGTEYYKKSRSRPLSAADTKD